MDPPISVVLVIRTETQKLMLPPNIVASITGDHKHMFFVTTTVWPVPMADMAPATIPTTIGTPMCFVISVGRRPNALAALFEDHLSPALTLMSTFCAVLLTLRVQPILLLPLVASMNVREGEGGGAMGAVAAPAAVAATGRLVAIVIGITTTAIRIGTSVTTNANSSITIADGDVAVSRGSCVGLPLPSSKSSLTIMT